MDEEFHNEVTEWLEAFDELLRLSPERCSLLLDRLNRHAAGHHKAKDSQQISCPFWNVNTIAARQQPHYPGDLTVERKLTAIMRWNAVAMVVRANRNSADLGGHLSTYASAAELYEVGFNHFFRGNTDQSGTLRDGDLVFFQPHAAPGIYARSFVEGRFTAEQIEHFRQECSGHGLSSYPHPQLMPSYWQFPTASMGLGLLTAVYQARFMRYLADRDVCNTASRKVWAFVGDGEMDEPESIAGISIAVRERLNNLIVVVNCNLQRLDGPVRGNGSIVAELERLFGGAGWNVIKVLWGSGWDEVWPHDIDGALQRRLNSLVDGELQRAAARGGNFVRAQLLANPDLLPLFRPSNEDSDCLDSGGHDPTKIFAAYSSAVEEPTRPTIIFARTIKGFGLGKLVQSAMSAHQQKKVATDSLRQFRDRFDLPITDSQVEDLRLYRPPADSVEMEYLLARREQLGGFLPSRDSRAKVLNVPDLRASDTDQTRAASTTTAFVRNLRSLLNDPSIGKFIVPIVADEARTFGMQSLFPKFGIYSPDGQCYEPEDRDNLLFYRESRQGQILEEGITEAGAMSSWIAAATSYAAHGTALLPFYIFYSIFGFQRCGDLIWAAADARARGFLIGATAGRTTLSGEGLQHQDGTSHLIASTVPSCRAFDPCFEYELRVIIEAGAKEILVKQHDVFFYVTVMNEAYFHPAMPEGAEEGILRGMYLLRSSQISADHQNGAVPRVQLLGSGALLREVLSASEILEGQFGVAADVWSVTSFTEMRRTSLKIDTWNRLNPHQQPKTPWVEACLSSTAGPIIAASDYVSAVPDLIRAWVPRRYSVLGTDGFGRSDTRKNLRRFFEVDREAIVRCALHSLCAEGTIKKSTVADFLAETRRHDSTGFAATAGP